ncbi:MAG: LCP family protein [Actinomycetota bacterium]|nr:LCP family protein [Actinomycetota bacterium]
MYQREDQYRTVDQQMRSAQRGRERTAHRRKRWLALLTVLVGVMVGVAAQTGVSLPLLMPSNENLARLGSPVSDGPATEDPGLAAGPSAEGTVLSLKRSTSESQPGETTEGAGGEATDGQEGAGTDEEEDSEKPEAPPPASGEPLYVLILGVDRRPSEAEGAPSRSDTMMLAQVSPGSGRVQLLSVPRDLLVEVKSGVEDRINTAYAYGGVEQAAAVVENLTDISADRYAIVDFGGFEEGIDVLGGVTLEVEEPITLGIEGRRVYIPAGRQELNGLEALAYARYRGTACGDLGRIKRQQRLVAALRQQALGWNTITRLPGIVKVMHENVDTNLGIVQTISLGRALAGRGEEGGMRSFQLKGKPETLPNGDAVLVPDEPANERTLENFRDDAPTSPGQDGAPGEENPSSEC